MVWAEGVWATNVWATGVWAGMGAGSTVNTFGRFFRMGRRRRIV